LDATAKNKESRSVFASNMHFLVKPNAIGFGFWAKIWNFLKPIKLIYMTIMCNRSIIWGHGEQIWCFGQVFATNWRFRSNRRLTPLDFEQKFKPHKNLYTLPLCITDPKYGGHGQEIWSLGQFSPQTSVFLGKTEC
jgi:hypothetical protein